MTENLPISSNPGASGVGRTGSSAGAKAPSATSAASAALFQSLIEKLEMQARELDADSKQVANPTDLAHAVDRAHTSLADALALGDQLLEAYRATLHTPDATVRGQ